VSIPVKLYPATQASAAISFNLLHKECGSRLKQQYICPRDEKIVSRDEMVKGYEFAKDQYVTFTAEELKALEERATQTIDISEFVPLAAVDPVYFDKPYYLGPEKGGEKAYHLLTQVMQETKRCALARYAARGKQYLVLLRPANLSEDANPEAAGKDRGLVMQQLLYADEVRSFAEVPLPDVPTVRDAELKLAHQLVDQISSETFDPTAYKDDVKKRIEADIQKKVEGKEIEQSEPTAAPAQIIDLMEALKASLGGGKPGKRKAEAPETERKPARRSAEDDKSDKAEKTSGRRSRAGRRS
jgi:DNA end-binding protein Ku